MSNVLSVTVASTIKQIFIAFVLIVIPISAFGQEMQSTGSVHGSVVIIDANGPSYIPGANVTLNGQVGFQAQSDAAGKFSFPVVPQGTYSITAQFTGVESKPETVEVKAGEVAELVLEVTPSEVHSSVEVTAEAEPAPTSSSSATIASETVINAPNQNDKAESLLPLVPGVVRGPDGRINMKGARSTQSGAWVNSANVTDPATGSPGLDVPIDVVSSVQVISNPYDPQYGKLTGAVSTVDTKTSNYEKLHFSIQNVAPRLRERGGSILGIGGATPRMTLTGPIIKNRIAFTESLEYRYIRTPVNSLPPTERDTTFEGVNSYSQIDLNLSARQTATLSVSLYPQKLKYLGLNTFTPQPSTPDYHQRGYQIYGQHRYVTGEGALLTSQLSYKKFDADITRHDNTPYQLMVDTTEGGFFNEQTRESSRFDLQETYQFSQRQFLGTHQLKAGFNYAHSTYDGKQTFLPVEIEGISGTPIERISFGQPNWANIHQNETSSFIADQWRPFTRLSFDLGVRLDSDSVTSSVHAAPRGGVQLALTSDGKTMLKGGAGIFYDRVPLMIAGFPSLPDRTVSYLDASGSAVYSNHFVNRITGDLANPRSTAWSVSLTRQVLQQLAFEVGYEHRTTSHDFVVSPLPNLETLAVSNGGNQSYHEFKVVGHYGFHGQALNASYVRSRAYGNLNDFFQFFGNVPKPVVQSQAEGRLSYDAPNRFLVWGELRVPWKVTLMPVYDIHTGFPYSTQDVYREYVGQRNSLRYPQFSSFDIQVLRPFRIRVGDRHLRARAGMAIFNVFNHFNPRDVQSIQGSSQFGQFYNDAWREFRGKLVFEF